MTVSILTNPSAGSAIINLNKSQKNMQESIAQITSGNRLTTPSVSPASYAIATKIKSSLSVFSQVSRNTAQAISVAQVASGGYSQINEILSKMKTLAAAVINPALGPEEKRYANSEFDKLRAQIDNTVAGTKFNGVALLNGGSGTITAFNSV